jgi:hypothetical protein
MENVPEGSEELALGGLARIQHPFDGEILKGLMVRVNFKKGPVKHQ